MKKNKLLSIVVITKNEQDKIGLCLTQLEKINFISKEIILVDSNSTDKTREIAKKYPIKIINIIQSNIYSPAAGRNIGLINSKGDYVLFLDGDQVINLAWLKKYMQLMEEGRFDAVYGKYLHILPGKELKKFKKISEKNMIGNFSNNFPGTSLIRNSAILREENFNPFMRGEEERDLSFRLIKRGYRIYNSNEEMAAHFLKKTDIQEAKEHIKYGIGVGQLIKKYFFSRFLLDIIKSYTHFFGLIALIVFSILLFLFHLPKILFLIPLIFALIYFIIKRKNSRIYPMEIIQIFSMLIKVIEGVFIEIFEKKEFIYSLRRVK
jgi:glycosyltransferase involved in cell wall biosynthesis